MASNKLLAIITLFTVLSGFALMEWQNNKKFKKLYGKLMVQENQIKIFKIKMEFELTDIKRDTETLKLYLLPTEAPSNPLNSRPTN